MSTMPPDAFDVADYLGNGASADDVEPVLRAEQSDQASRCRVEPFNDALAEALKRRVARNLAMRNLPLGVQMDETGGTRMGSSDPEVRRLEAPYRRLVVG